MTKYWKIILLYLFCIVLGFWLGSAVFDWKIGNRIERLEMKHET